MIGAGYCSMIGCMQNVERKPKGKIRSRVMVVV